MREPRNPFTLRSSESIENELTFLKLFGAGVLDMLPDESFLNKVTIFRSGPGGGKTSLLRLFRPESLNEIFQHGTEYKELHEALENFGVISDTGPDLLGIYLRLSDYGSFQDIDEDEKSKEKYLISLIGARLILKMLHGILALKNSEFSDLHRIFIEKPLGENHLENSPLPCNGEELYHWASKLEQNICGVTNRFDHNIDKSIPLFENLDHIYGMIPKSIKFDGKSVTSKILIMLDDLQHLRKNQRKNLLEKITKARYPISIWFAERLEALELDELIPGIHGREYFPVYLEEYWERSKGKTFETFVRSISTKRAQFAKLDFELSSLHEHLEESIDNSEWSLTFKKIVNEIKDRLKKFTLSTNMYDEWIEEQEKKIIQSPKDAAIDWKSLEIKIAREEKSAQKKLFDVPLEVDDDEDISSLSSASEFFIHEEFKVPYYFGFSRISRLATSNIEQFLEIASELFEHLISQLIKSKKDNILLAAKQENIIRKIAKRHWDEIPKKNNNGRQIVKFLSSFENFARDQTLQPTASYERGITGFGIKKSLYEQIIDPDSQNKFPELKELADVLQTCISQNYLKARYKARQGKKGSEELTILYLNRNLCAHFGLPLGKGGFRHKTPKELCEWLGFENPLTNKVTS